MLQVVPERLTQVVISMETMLNLDELSLEDATGRLRVVEQKYNRASNPKTDAHGRLLLMEEWRLRGRQREEGSFGSFQARGGGCSAGGRRGRGRGRGRDGLGMMGLVELG